MTVNLAASPAAAALPSPGGGAGPQASQNLFEHMAETSKGMPQGASPHQIGSNLMERLDGFIDRSRQFSERADALTQGNAPQSASQASTRAPRVVRRPVKSVSRRWTVSFSRWGGCSITPSKPRW